MKTLMALALMLAMTPAVAAAQDAIPQLKGTWKGTGKISCSGPRNICPDLHRTL
jgi:hypothetical protein